MKVFVTGATGVLGRRVVATLVERGDDVIGLARSDANTVALRAVGATPCAGDLFDADSLMAATAGADAVLHLATKIPRAARGWRAKAWRENDRIRDTATPLLVDAALANGAPTFVFPSITFGYQDCGDRWIDESVPYGDDSPALAATVAAERETARFAGAGARGVVLRMAMFVGPDASTTADARRGARLGRGPCIGPPEGYISTIWLDDAAAAVVSALTAPSGTYNVAVDEPQTRGECCAAVAAALGTSRLKPMPAYAVSRIGAGYLARSQRIANAAFKAATGWTPQVGSSGEAWRLAVERTRR